MKKLLIVVDYQIDFVSGPLGFEKALELEKPIAAKINKYRETGDDIAFTFDAHNENYLNTQEGKNLPVPHCIKGTKGVELYGEVAKLNSEGDLCFYKPSFGSAQLFEYLRDNEYESIELVGLVSNICVLSNAVLAKAAQPETPVIVDAACSTGNDTHLHNAALDVMEGVHIRIINR